MLKEEFCVGPEALKASLIIISGTRASHPIRNALLHYKLQWKCRSLKNCEIWPIFIRAHEQKLTFLFKRRNRELKSVNHAINHFYCASVHWDLASKISQSRYIYTGTCFVWQITFYHIHQILWATWLCYIQCKISMHS